MRTKFRETLWFKKGSQDEVARDEAHEVGDLFAPAAVDSLPIEDRYNDDGSLALIDSVAFGVHTGRTEYMPKSIPSGTGTSSATEGHAIDEHLLVGDLKRGRIRILAAMGGVAALAVAFAVFVF